METMAEIKMLSTRIPADLHRALRVLAIETGHSVQELVEAAIRDLLERHGKEV